MLVGGPNSTSYPPASFFKYDPNEFLVLSMNSTVPAGSYVLNITFDQPLIVTRRGGEERERERLVIDLIYVLHLVHVREPVDMVLMCHPIPFVPYVTCVM